MTENFESPAFQAAKDKLRSSITNPGFDKTNEPISLNQPGSRQMFLNTSEYNSSKIENLGLQDLTYNKSFDSKPPVSSERQTKPQKGDDNQEEVLVRKSLDIQSPDANSYFPKSTQHRYMSGPYGKNLYDMGSENLGNVPATAKASYNSAYDQAAYARLENEIINLKKTLIERLSNQEQEKEKEKEKEREKEPKISNQRRSKIDFEQPEKTVSDDEEESPFKMESKRAKSKGKEIHMKDLKTNNKTNTLQKNVRTSTKQSKGGYEETIGGKVDKKGITKEDKKNSEKNVTGGKLKNTLKPKEKVVSNPEEKYTKLKEKYKELRSVCREYVEKAEDLEAILKSKEAQLESYEAEIKRKHESLIEKGEIIIDFKRQLSNRDEKIERITKEFEFRFREQEDRIERQIQATKDREKEYRTEKDQFLGDIAALKVELETMTTKEAIAIKKKESVQQELELANVELDTKNAGIEELSRIAEERAQEILDLKSELRRVKIENEDFKERNREIEAVRKDNEETIIRDKRNYEDIISRLNEEREKETQKQKEKFENLKEELKSAWNASDKAKEEKTNLSIALDKVEIQKRGLEEELRKTKEKLRQTETDKELSERELERIKVQKEELYGNVQHEGEKASRLENENKRLEITIKTLEGKLNLKDKEIERLEEMNSRMREEMNGLVHTAEKSRDYTVKIERELDAIQIEYNEERMQLERRIDKLNKELQLANDENRMLKISESRLNRELNAIREEKDRYRGEYRELRETNKTLEKDLKELDEKVRDVISSKSLETQEQTKDETYYRQSSAYKQSSALKQSGSKLKVLDEIQDMLKGYRLTQRKFDSQDS